MGEDNGLHINIGFWGLLALIFITLKLTHTIAWSWFWVLCPLLIPLIFMGLITLISIIIVGVVSKWRW
jgi:hypothetical protein